MRLEQLRDRYLGDRAQRYDQERIGTPLWRAEDEAMRTVLSRLGADASVIDVPVGTGRFARMYREFGLAASGVDASREMLAQAADKGLSIGLDWALHIGDIGNLPFKDASFDAAICIRFLNWVDETMLYKAIGELARVSRSHVIFGVRTFRPWNEFDIRRVRDLREWFLQWKWRFYEFRTRAQFRLHESSSLERALVAHDLEVVEKLPIRTKKSGFDYSFYVTKCR